MLFREGLLEDWDTLLIFCWLTLARGKWVFIFLNDFRTEPNTSLENFPDYNTKYKTLLKVFSIHSWMC